MYSFNFDLDLYSKVSHMGLKIYMLYLYPNQGEILTMYKVGYCDIYTT